MTAAEARNLALSSPDEDLREALDSIKKAASKGCIEVSLWALSVNALRKLEGMGYSTSCQGRNGFGEITHKISWGERV
jgi:hypothetical protein